MSFVSGPAEYVRHNRIYVIGGTPDATIACGPRIEFRSPDEDLGADPVMRQRVSEVGEEITQFADAEATVPGQRPDIEVGIQRDADGNALGDNTADEPEFRTPRWLAMGLVGVTHQAGLGARSARSVRRGTHHPGSFTAIRFGIAGRWRCSLQRAIL